MTLVIPLMLKKQLIIGLYVSIKGVEIMTRISNKQDAERKATEFYDEYFDLKESIFKGVFATNLHHILQKMGIRLIIQSLKPYEEMTGKTDVSGLLLKNGDEYAIFVEEGDSIERKRFTIAHEIGHKVLNHVDDAEYVSISFRDDHSSNGSNSEEIAANAFAAVLLMPEKIVRHVYTLTSDIAMTASYLGVSDTALRYRLSSLGILR